MGGVLDSRYVGRVYGADGAVYPSFLSDLMKLEFSQQIFENIQIKLHESLFRGNRVGPCRQTDRQT